MKRLIIAFATLLLIGATGCNQQGTDGAKDAVDSVSVSGISVDASKYTIVLYSDNTGDFFTPEGGRICGFELYGGRKEPMNLSLTSRILILGKNTDELRLSRDRLFADYSDYLSYYNNYHPDTTLGVPVEKYMKDGVEVYSVALNNDQIEKFDKRKHEIGSNQNNEYTLICYSDESGHLFDCDGSHICAVKRRSTTIQDAGFTLSKNVKLYGESTNELEIYEDKIYLSFSDIQNDRYPSISSGYSKYKATVTTADEGDAVIYRFSMTAAAPERLSEETSSSSSEAKQSEDLSPQDKQKMLGWNYLRNNYSEFSNASLRKYLPPTAEPSRELAKALDYPGLSTATYESSFGDTYVVIFVNDIPRTALNAKTTKGDMNQWRNAVHYVLDRQ